MPSSSVERRLAALLSADAVSYSRLMAEDELATVHTITAYREQIATLVREHGGRVVDSPGDNLLAEFSAASASVSCALEIQRVIAARNASLPEARRMAFRIGLHVGEVLVEGERIYGDGVNVAARLEGLADTGGVVISSALRDQVRRLDGIVFDDLGAQRLKNIPGPVGAFRVRTATDGPANTGMDGPPSLAVLPFQNMSGDPDQEYFADGITEDLITDLSRLSGLFVTARTSAFSYKGRSLRADEIGRELGVRYLLEGSVRRAGDRVRINAQLIEATSGHHVWAERFDRELADIFALQDEITREIVAALRVRLDADESRRGERTPTENMEAYDLYLRALSYFAGFDRAGILRARALLESALALDPDFAAALSALGNTYTTEHALWGEDNSAILRAEALIRDAIALDPLEADSHTDLSRALWMRGHAEESLAEAQRGLELHPGNAEAFVMLAHGLRAAGRLDEAVDPAERAVRLDPLSANARFERGSLRYLRGRHAEAEADLRWTLVRSPDFFPAHLIFAACLASQGRDAEAKAETAEALRLAPGYSIAEMNRRVPLSGSGDGRLERDLRRAGIPE